MHHNLEIAAGRGACRGRRRPRYAALNVFATVPEWGALTQELGGDKVNVYVATNALQDPHHVEAKPSLIARARTADLVVATGAELEIGWLPLVTAASGQSARAAGQARLLRGRGARHAARQADAPRPRRRRRARRGRPAHPDRSAQHRARRRGRWRRGSPSSIRRNAAYYASRLQGLLRTLERRDRATGRSEGAPLRGVPIVVQHKAFTYLIAWLGMNEIAALEPKPGVEPTTAYLTDRAGNAAAPAGEDGAARGVPERSRVAVDRRAREDQRRRAAVHGRRRRPGQGSLRTVRRHDRAAAQGGAMNWSAVELSILLPALRRRPAGDGDARAARHAGARARHRLHRPRDRADRRLRRVARRSLGFEARGDRGAGVGACRRAGRCAAAHLDRARFRRRAGSGHRRRVRTRRDRRRAAACEQRARRRAPARPAGRPDPVGAARALAVGRAGVRGNTRAVVRCRRHACRVPVSTCCSRSPSRCRCNWSDCIWCSHRSSCRRWPRAAWSATGSPQRGRSARSAMRWGSLVSTAPDLPSGPVIVWMLVAFAVVVEATARQRLPSG